MRLVLDDRPFATTAPPVTAGGAYQPVSFWQETIQVEPGAPLAERTNCDVAIVGGGFSGLSTAYELKRARPDLDIVLLERAVVGHGASGRNGGFAMPLIGWDLTDAVKKLGRDGGQRAYRLMYEAVKHLQRVVDEEQIACDLEATGYLLISTAPKRDAHIRHEADLGRALGFDHELLEGDALAEHIQSDSFRIGVYDPHPVILNPAKLARGLKQAVERLGVRVYEQTPITELSDGESVTINTPRGGVTAKTAVLALNGYGASLGFMADRIAPVHTYISLTEPLTDAQLETIGWAKRRTSLETARNFIHYFRLTADNRIAFGGEDAQLFAGGSYQDHYAPCFALLEARLREFFPSLVDVRFTHRWGGVLGVTLDMFPTFGVGGERKNVFHAAGYSGHGVALSNYAGRILAPKILCRLDGNLRCESADDPFFFNRLPWWMPGGAARYYGLQIYRAALRAHDWWMER